MRDGGSAPMPRSPPPNVAPHGAPNVAAVPAGQGADTHKTSTNGFPR